MRGQQIKHIHTVSNYTFQESLSLKSIPTRQGRNQPLYERHVTKLVRNRVKARMLLEGQARLLVSKKQSAVLFYLKKEGF